MYGMGSLLKASTRMTSEFNTAIKRRGYLAAAGRDLCDPFWIPPRSGRDDGYAWADALVCPTKTRREILEELGLAHIGDDRIVLFAPTWTQDEGERQIFPFGIDAEHFLAALVEVCHQHGASWSFAATSIQLTPSRYQ